MSHAHLRSVDLNLLVALDALLRLRSVSAAARELGLSQSGASRALARLRAQLDDPLLVPVGRGLEPTARGRALAEPAADLLARAGELFRSPVFSPKSASGSLRVGLPDHLAWLVGPRLLERLASDAPGVDLVMRSFSSDWRRELRDGDVDVAFGVVTGDEVHLRQRAVFDDPWRVVLAADHPAARGPWSVEVFAALDHGMMTVTGSGPGHVDRALATLGLERRVRARASSPLVAAMLARNTQLAVTTTHWLATELAALGGLLVRDLPLEVPPLRLPMVWHERADADPRQRWARGLLVKVVRTAATNARGRSNAACTPT